jgi:hypothetical protein
VKPVKAALMLYIDKEHYSCCHGYCQPKDIDKAEAFLPYDIAPGYFEIVEQHNNVSEWLVKTDDKLGKTWLLYCD